MGTPQVSSRDQHEIKSESAIESRVADPAAFSNVSSETDGEIDGTTLASTVEQNLDQRDQLHRLNDPDLDEWVSDSRPGFRLLVVSSSVLTEGAVAIVEEHDIVSLGRDRHPGPNIRLKEMAVSKYHAYVFWDQQNTTWSIADAGSVHGTFIQRDGFIPPLLGSINEPENKVRLSAQRTASQPLGLQHLDYVDIGSTTFVAHIHSTEPICERCIGTQVILLSEATLNPASSSRKPVENQIRFETSQDPKKALKDLKSVLLNPTRHSPLPSQQTTTATATYVDRSARRREITGSYGSGSSEQSNKDVIVKPRSSSRSYVDPRLKDIFPTPHDESSPAVTAPASNPSPAPPIPSSNIGHRLLVKSGWSPGQALGPDKSSGLVQPLNLKRFEHRAGIGSDNSRREDG